MAHLRSPPTFVVTSFLEARDLISRVKGAQRVVELHRTTQPRRPSSEIAQLVLALLEPAAHG